MAEVEANAKAKAEVKLAVMEKKLKMAENRIVEETIAGDLARLG
jgi:hypothetical protein